ncbi:MAG: peroxiredoxin family protein [Pyrinomonadaceae bacterium]
MSILDLGVESQCLPIAVGQAAPDFALFGDDEREWRLFDSLDAVTVLLFYPQNETLVCTRQLCSVRDNWEHYLETKANIVAISPSTPAEHREFSRRRQLPIRLLADPGRVVTQVYGKHWLFPINLTRAVVVIDTKGIVRNRDVMLRAFRPSDDHIITDIYAARGDALNEEYSNLRTRIVRAMTQK